MTARSLVGQLLLDSLLRTDPKGRMGRPWSWTLQTARRGLLRVMDPDVTYAFYDMTLRLPLSHQLPLFRKEFPEYSDNLRRVAAGLAAKYPGLVAIDVGANVGDSVAVLVAGGIGAITAVEPDDRYFALLVENVASRPSIHPKKLLLADVAGERRGELRVQDGTGSWTDESSGQSILATTLDELVAAEVNLGRVRLVKCDTDGFDLRILRGAPRLLATGPVLFFEYDPDACPDEDGPSFLEWLGELGYERLLLWDNFGRLLLSTTPHEAGLLADVDAYYRQNPDSYLDIAAYTSRDAELADEIAAAERAGSRRS